MAYETTVELRQLLQDEVNDTTPSSDTQARYLQLLDTAHKAVVGGGGELNLDDSGNPIRRPYLFSWAKAEDPITVTLEPKQETSGSFVQDSNSATIGIASGTKDLSGWHVRVNNTDTVYRILTHASTAITLGAAFVAETDAAATIEVFKLIYTIQPTSGEILLPFDSFRVFYRRSAVSLTGEAELLNQYPLFQVREGNPRLSGLVKQTQAGMIVRFSSYPKERQVVELPFAPKPADLAVTPSPVNPIIPNGEKRRVIVHLAAFYHMRKRDDDRAQSHLKSAKALFDALKTEDEQFSTANDAFFGYIAPFGGGFPVSSQNLNPDVDNIP